ncbi:uncharacterized protein EDB91DRAFT_1048508, partial [Suillus paluster]|uniref:uncharacterized protein n=1 Tax=Suillus paluster TaxID=48578 RepID=UPI001B881B58
GVVTNSNITLVDEVSGILGLGFQRQSEISASATNATSFCSTLAQQGILEYPLFGLSLTRNATGTLTLGQSPPGAIDVSVAQNLSQVVPFSPVCTQTNTSGYFYWAIPLSSFAYTPQPTYPCPTGNTFYWMCLCHSGTPGLYGPYQDVSSRVSCQMTRFHVLPGNTTVHFVSQ